MQAMPRIASQRTINRVLKWPDRALPFVFFAKPRGHTFEGQNAGMQYAVTVLCIVLG